jgi:hypothetical protein
MAECGFCGREMREADSCTKNAIVVPLPRSEDSPVSPNHIGAIWAAIPFGEEDATDLDEVPADADFRCHDCGVAVGGYHHPGCDWERNPADGHGPDQLLSFVLQRPAESAPSHARMKADPHVDISWDEVMEQNRRRTAARSEEDDA